MKAVMVIASKDFKDEEYFVPKEILQKGGVDVQTASTSMNAVSSAGTSIMCDMLIENIPLTDAIILVGGMGAQVLFDNLILHERLKEYDQKERVVAAICISPVTLDRAGLLNGKKATVFPTGVSEMKNARYTDESIVVDGNIITARDPAAAEEFGKAILCALGSC